MPMPPLISFIIMLTLLFILIILKVDITYGLTIATILFGLLVFTPQSFIISLFNGIFNYTTLRLFLAFISAFYLSDLLRNLGVLNYISNELSKISERLAAIIIPSIVGLIPMPGGAMVSAMMLKDLYFNKLKLKPHIATYINYWFRHIWISVWPLYQAVILASYILNISIWKLIYYIYPSAIIAIISGLIVVIKLLGKSNVTHDLNNKIDFTMLFMGLWPFILVIILVIGLKLDILLALLITIIAVIIIYKPSRKHHLDSIKFAFSPKIILVVLVTMVLKEFIVSSAASKQLYELMTNVGLSQLFIAFLIPFIVALAMPGEYVVVAITFPLLLDILMPMGIIEFKTLLAAFFGGYMGIYFSPTHLCLILTREYFQARLDLTYKYILSSIAIATSLMAILLLVL